jgi:hypothetical protein
VGQADPVGTSVVDEQKLRMIRDAVASIESQINEDLSRLIGRPLPPLEELEEVALLEVPPERALEFAVANSMRIAMMAVSVRSLAEELLSGATGPV